MTKLLDIEVVDFECRVCYRALLSWRCRLEEERVVIRVLLFVINMKETGDRRLVFIDNV